MARAQVGCCQAGQCSGYRWEFEEDHLAQPETQQTSSGGLVKPFSNTHLGGGELSVNKVSSWSLRKI